MSSEMKTIKDISKEYSDMLQSLEEGIVVVKDAAINFSNDIFKEILHRVVLPSNQNSKTSILDLKIFKIYRKTEDKEEEEVKSVYKREVREGLMNLRYLLDN